MRCASSSASSHPSESSDDETRRSRLDDEVLELLADEPELLAIADAVVETQRPRRRVRPAGIVASAVVLAAVVALAFAFWPNGRSDGISDSTAVAAIGGRARWWRPASTSLEPC